MQPYLSCCLKIKLHNLLLTIVLKVRCMSVGRAMRQRPCSHTAPRLLVQTLTLTQGMRQSRPSPSASENLLGKSPASVNAPSLAEEVSFVLTHQKEYLFLFQSLNRKYILIISICHQRQFLQRKRKYICIFVANLTVIYYGLQFCFVQSLNQLCYVILIYKWLQFYRTHHIHYTCFVQVSSME